MRLLLPLLVLSSCAPGLCFLSEIIEGISPTKEKLLNGSLSIDELKKSLFKIWGFDPEARKERLERIAKKTVQRLGGGRFDDIKKQLEEFKPVHLEKPNGTATVGLFELNEQEGVSQFLYQGDLLLTEEQLNQIEQEVSESDRKKRQAYRYANKWTGNTLYFYFDRSINQRKRNSVYAAHDYIRRRTCINFVENASVRNRVRVINGNGCYSSVGMTGNEQTLSLGNGCEVIGTTAHEFAHALGIQHMQMRSDRDTYVRIDLSDVQSGQQGNFAKMNPASNILYTPYEYGSYMHYPANAFTNRRTSLSIISQDRNQLFTMGSSRISFYDILMLNEYYGCNSLCNAQNSAKCQNGGVPNPRDCSTCNCPSGYGGALCDQRPQGCGETLTATTNWQSREIGLGNTADTVSRDVHTICNHWISAPAGATIEVKITNMVNSQCNYGCPFNGIEIKADANQKVTNPLICCPEFNNQVIRSSLNPAPVITFNRFGYSRFTIAFRYVGGSPPQPGPATKATVPPTSNCVDQLPRDCSEYVTQMGSCQGLAVQQAREYCAKTCGYCNQGPQPTPLPATSAPSTCQDLPGYQCQQYSNGRTCPNLRQDTAEYYCPKSCGFCTTNPGPTTARPGPAGPCEDATYCSAPLVQQNCSGLSVENAKKNCARSCGYCQTPSNQCRDTVYCSPELVENNCAGIHVEIARTYCAKSCGWCGKK